MTRHLSPELYTDDWFGTLDMISRMLWIGLLTTVADDQGRFIDNPAIIRVKIFPYDETITSSDISRRMNGFVDSHRLMAFHFGLNGSKKNCCQIVNWWKYQSASAWMGKSSIPAPDGWMDRIRCHAAGNQIVTENWDKPGGLGSGYVGATQPLLSREGEVKVKVKGEGEVKSEVKSEKTDDDNPADLIPILKLCGIPTKYQQQINDRLEIDFDDLVAELTRNYARKDKINNPGLITAMNLARGETAGQEWYEPQRWTRHLPKELQLKLSLSSEDEPEEDFPVEVSDYTQSEKKDDEWEKAKGILAQEIVQGLFKRHVEKTSMVSLENGTMTVACPDQNNADMLNARIRKTAMNILKGICNCEIDLQFVVAGKGA